MAVCNTLSFVQFFISIFMQTAFCLTQESIVEKRIIESISQENTYENVKIEKEKESDITIQYVLNHDLDNTGYHHYNFRSKNLH